jgi:hypothetical protein
MSLTWESVSGWWAPACFVLGLLYAWFMYRKPVQLSKEIRYALFAARALLVSLLALLIVSPLVRTTSYQPQKPVILIAQDNSESIKLFSNLNDVGLSSSGLAKLKATLGEDYEVHDFTFDKELYDGLSNTFNGKQTDISNALRQLNERFVNRNIGALVLSTDGLYNIGTDPQYEARNIKTSIYTIALGDTVPHRDLLISNVNYNKSALLGNDFEVEVLAEAYQSKGEQMQLIITEDGRRVQSQTLAITSAAFKKMIPLKLNADKKGIRKFTISLAPLKNELSVQNNTESLFIDVLDARQKILLLYDGPHPDISVIKQSIESNKNYEVKTSLTSDLGALKTSDYSMAILYQLSADSYSKMESLRQSKMPMWHIAGTQTNVQAFNNVQKGVRINSTSQEVQEVFAQPVATFSAFTLTDSTRNKLNKLPPLVAPFGSYQASATAAVLLKQKIGNVETAYPLLAFTDDSGTKSAVLTGEGLWRWQLAEYREYGNHHALEELLSQTVQYLTADANRQRFSVYTAKNVFDEGENVLLNAELYNDALQLINTPDVKINLKSSTGKNYSFLFARSGQSYQLNASTLPVGDYTYTAATNNGKQAFTANGRLAVKQLNLEARQSTANHQLLRAISAESGGKMLLPSQVNQLASLIRKNENIKTVVYEDKHYSDLIDVKWVFVLIILLLSAEWFLRKREGEI